MRWLANHHDTWLALSVAIVIAGLWIWFTPNRWLKLFAVVSVVCFLMGVMRAMDNSSLSTVVLVTACPNPNCMTFNTRAELTDKMIEVGNRGQLGELNGLLEILLKIAGVVSCFLGPYEVTVVKAAAFSWEEIMPHVAEILEGLNRQAL